VCVCCMTGMCFHQFVLICTSACFVFVVCVCVILLRESSLGTCFVRSCGVCACLCCVMFAAF